MYFLPFLLLCSMAFYQQCRQVIKQSFFSRNATHFLLDNALLDSALLDCALLDGIIASAVPTTVTTYSTFSRGCLPVPVGTFHNRKPQE